MFLKAGQPARVVDENVTTPKRPKQFARGGNELFLVGLLKVASQIEHGLDRVSAPVGEVGLQGVNDRGVSGQADLDIKLSRKIRGKTVLARDAADGGVGIAIEQFTTNRCVKFQGVLAVSFYVLRE